jgi:multiple sugar transport system ATP-binding protein
MSSVRFESVTHLYSGAETPSVQNLELTVEDKEFMVLVGPSGCGKTTSLRMLAGLEQVSSGAIYIGERNVTQLAPKARDIAMVFQNYALYPHMTVADIMGFALKMAGVPKKQITTKVTEAAALLGLGDMLKRKPRALSGGQRQRVAMGRAIVREPNVFLMDEPLSNLDAKLRVQTRSQIAALQRRLGVTTVYVTHDQTEAMTMGDRVAVLKDGVLQQVDTPRAMYARPANAFVAAFIGSPQMNLFTADIIGDTAHIAGHPITINRDTLTAATAEGATTLTVGARPEDLRLTTDTEPATITAEVIVVEELGADAYIHARINGTNGNDVIGSQIIVRGDGRNPPTKGQPIHITIDPHIIHTFSTKTGERI